MAVTGTDLVLVERDGSLYKAEAGEIANLGSGGGVFAPSSAINSNGAKRIGNRNGYGNLGGQALSVGWVYFQPFAPGCIEQVTGAGLEVTISGAGSVIIGLYNVTSGTSAALVAATGLIDVSAVGFRTANFPAAFTPDRTEYLLAIATNVQCTTRAQAAINGQMPIAAGGNNGQFFVSRAWDGTLPSTVTIAPPAGFRSLTNIAFLTA